MLAWFSRHLKRPRSFDGPALDAHGFELRLAKGWQQETTDDSEQYSFAGNDGSMITASWMAWNVDPDRLPNAAEVLLETRAKAMVQRLGDYPYIVTELDIAPVPYPGIEIYAYGAAEQISYYSRHYALLTGAFVFNLYVESPASTAKANAAQFGAVLAGLGIKTVVQGEAIMLRPTRAPA